MLNTAVYVQYKCKAYPYRGGEIESWGRGVNMALNCVQRLKIVPRCVPLPQGISKTPPTIIFCPMWIFGPRCGPVAKLGNYGPAAPRWEIWGD